MRPNSQPSNPPVDIRDAFFDEVYRLARADRRVMVLTDDQGAFALDKIRHDLPDQYINVGIAEQNLINVAAGLALGGIKPFACGISNFMSLRCCEQISVNVCAMNLPVTIVASGGGLTYSADGPTHHSIQDAAIMRTMPGIQIFNPADAASTAASARLSYEAQGPTYVRIEKGLLPALYNDPADLRSGLCRLADGNDVLIISTGILTQTAVKVAEQLHVEGVACGVLDLFRLKPLNVAALLSNLRRARRVVVLEEQTPIGGIASLICETLGEHAISRPVRRYCLPDVPCYRYGTREWLHEQFGLDAASIAHEVMDWTHRHSAEREDLVAAQTEN